MNIQKEYVIQAYYFMVMSNDSLNTPRAENQRLAVNYVKNVNIFKIVYEKDK